MEWDEIIAAARASNNYDALKAQLPLTYVFEQTGREIELSEDGRAHTICPFHTDTDPSLDIFGEHFERWGCYPCGIGGDIFDLLRRWTPGMTFPQAIVHTEELIKQMHDEGWTGPQGVEKKDLDYERVVGVVAQSQAELGGLSRFLDGLQPSVPFSPEQLNQAFGVGSVGDSVVIPYFDQDGHLITYKHRTPASKAFAVGGSKFDGLLYGDWRDTSDKPVLLCEGESDTWVGAYYMGQRYSVLGLPTGTGTLPIKYVDRLAGRLVVLAFDGDDAGRSATKAWAAGLLKSSVLFAPLPEGLDLRDLGDAVPGVVAMSAKVEL